MRAFGRKHVKGVVVAELGQDGRPDPDTERGFDCDLVAVSGGTVPATSLLLQAGAKARWDSGAGAYVPDATPEGIYAAGAVAGHESAPAQSLSSGAVAGAEAALSLELGGPEDRTRLEADRAALAGEGAGRVQAVPPPGTGKNGKCFACLCEDVTTKDITYSVEEGYDSLELSKRYTTLTMGPCQGRMCQLASIRKMAEDTGTPVADVGLTTARPPWSTVPMGAMAGRPFEPAKRSAVHGRHRELGGNVMWAGDWRRPYDYGDPARRDDGRARGRRADRRLHARQADGARAGRRRVPESAVPEPLRQPEAGPRSATACSATTPAASPTTARSAASTTTPSTSRPPPAAPTRSRPGSPGGWRSGSSTST